MTQLKGRSSDQPTEILSVALALAVVASWTGSRKQTGGARSEAPCRHEAMAKMADSLGAKFDDHQFVFIGSTHGDLKIEEFLTCLVSRPAFTARVTDIVAEQVSSGQQQTLDRYVL